MEIKGELKGELDMKRFYLGNVKIYDNCPKCNTKNEYGGYCLHRPLMNEANTLNWFCSNCEHEWNTQIILNISIEKAND